MSVKHVLSAGLLFLLVATSVSAKDYHVAVGSDDASEGASAKQLKTISAAAALAQPGDTITVHAGTYREQINPPRGGLSDAKRIVYRAAAGEEVVIKGSEIIKGWESQDHDTWKTTVPNAFFGDFNPYGDLIQGDWFNPLGREHHTGAVYLDGHWLTEAASLDDVLQPIGEASASYLPGSGAAYLLNVAWLRPTDGAARLPATGFAAQSGVQAAPCSEGGECIGWIESGDWVRYEGVDFGAGAGDLEIRAASATSGGVIEVRLDAPDGELLGACTVPHTGGWQSWKSFRTEIEPTSGVQTICLVFRAIPRGETTDVRLWFARVDSSDTTIWAQFDEIDPNAEQVEINVRQSVFYPRRTGINYLTVRGFTMMHAATPWAPPTAEQIGLIGVNWSKGWIIENNDISYSTCVGVTLGKHGDAHDNTSADTAEGYVKTIERGLANGWSKENIGSHIVRNNHISHCEQAGIVGSLGAVFSTISGNEIHDIYARRLFTGAEMAGIKLHAAIDTEISGNYIYRAGLGIWLDWMTQGTRVTRNLLHDNTTVGDLFVEVNHGPFLVDNNIFLSARSLLDVSEGGAYVHNLFGGGLQPHPEPNRLTPYHPAHSTEVAGLVTTKGGDNRFLNNLFVAGSGLSAYDGVAQPVFMAGNVFLGAAEPSPHERHPLVLTASDPVVQVADRADGVYLEMALDSAWMDERNRSIVTTEALGRAAIPDLPYEQPDGSAYRLNTDYSGNRRKDDNPCPGPFARPAAARSSIKVWSRAP